MANEAMHGIGPAVVATERVFAPQDRTARLLRLKASFAVDRLRVRDQGRSYNSAAAWPRGWHPPALASKHERDRDGEAEPPSARPKASAESLTREAEHNRP